ncbi:MAG: hypothetical protein HPY76_04055 [Anaerolineae bacterium]|nr:hypothetical protein [Anaerolineae bacterium]
MLIPTRMQLSWGLQALRCAQSEGRLAVASTNPVASGVYQRAGMTRQHTYLQLVRQLSLD